MASFSCFQDSKANNIFDIKKILRKVHKQMDGMRQAICYLAKQLEFQEKKLAKLEIKS